MDPLATGSPAPISSPRDGHAGPDPGPPRTPGRSRWAITPETSIGYKFWLLFAASTMIHTGYSASIPLLPRFVQDVFDGSPTTVGAVVAATPIVSLFAQPVAGMAADRYGYRRLCIVGAFVTAGGMSLTALATSIPVVGASRVIFGAGDAAALTGLMAWTIAVATPSSRGRALSMFGVSVWIGIAIGPLLGETVFQSAGFRTVWTGCAVLLLAATGLIMMTSAPTEDPAGDAGAATSGSSRREWRTVLGAVQRPASVAAIVWGAQGVMLAFLVIHLESRGLRTDGPTGAAAVFTVFAVSVIAARILLGSLPDTLGAARSARYSLVCLTVGLVLITVSRSFLFASLGAVLLGVAFAPLYPALVILAVRDLDPSRRATGLGAFNAFSSLGMAIGSFAGGVLSGWWGAWSAFAVAAASQVVAFVIIGPTRD